jgi:hypothetical protein
LTSASRLCDVFAPDFTTGVKGGSVPASIHLLFPKIEYARLLERCDRRAPLYEHLVNGIIERDDAGQERVRVFCDEAREREIYEFIRHTEPRLVLVINRIQFTGGVSEWKRLIA